jgi:hypothetical protein
MDTQATIPPSSKLLVCQPHGEPGRRRCFEPASHDRIGERKSSQTDREMNVLEGFLKAIDEQCPFETTEH